jgi:HD-like signal output (HDOD) protein
MDTYNKFNDFLAKSPGHIRIPPLKMNIHVLIRAFADADMPLAKLVSVLNNYPVIVARLLGLANSSWACPATPINNLETACVRLGNNMVKTVSLALVVASSFDTSRCPSFDTTRFWMTSLLVAEGGALLAAKLPNKNQFAADFAQMVQTAGILHNLGMLWLADNMASEAELAIKLSLANPELNINQAIKQCIGVDYCRIGAWMFKQWELPDEVIMAVAHHHDKHEQVSASAPAVLIGAAAAMVDDLFHDCPETAENNYLRRLGIELAQQNQVFEQLTAKRESIHGLAEMLFS